MTNLLPNGVGAAFFYRKYLRRQLGQTKFQKAVLLILISVKIDFSKVNSDLFEFFKYLHYFLSYVDEPAKRLTGDVAPLTSHANNQNFKMFIFCNSIAVWIDLNSENSELFEFFK